MFFIVFPTSSHSVLLILWHLAHCPWREQFECASGKFTACRQRGGRFPRVAAEAQNSEISEPSAQHIYYLLHHHCLKLWSNLLILPNAILSKSLQFCHAEQVLGHCTITVWIFLKLSSHQLCCHGNAFDTCQLHSCCHW